MGRRRLRRAIVVYVYAVSLASRSAAADVLIESYRGERPGDADRELEVVRRELARAGVAVEPRDVIAQVGDQLPLPGMSDPRLGPSYAIDLNSQVELGTKQVFRGDYDAGIATLEDVLAGARDNAALVVGDPASPTWLTKAYAALAFARLRTHDDSAAAEVIAEQARSFPDEPIGRIVGPQVSELSDTTRKALAAAPHSALRIVVSQPDVQIAVNEHVRGTGRALMSLVPNKYRLLLIEPGRPAAARRLAVTLVPDRDRDLYLDWTAVRAFQVTPAWIGFLWPRQHDDRTAATVAQYAHASRRHDYLVVSVVRTNQRRFVVGATFEKASGAALRGKAIALDAADSEACKRALVQYLLKGDSSPCLIELPVEAGDPPASAAVGRDERDPYLAPGVTAGLGAAAVIGGATLLAVVPPDTGEPRPRTRLWTGIGLVAGGGLAVTTAVLWATRGAHTPDALRRSRAPIYAAAATAAAALAGAAYLFHVDGTGTCAHPDSGCRYFYATRPAAWALVATGIVATGAGIYWPLQAPREARTAVIGVVPSGAGALAIWRARF